MTIYETSYDKLLKSYVNVNTYIAKSRLSILSLDDTMSSCQSVGQVAGISKTTQAQQ